MPDERSHRKVTLHSEALFDVQLRGLIGLMLMSGHLTPHKPAIQQWE